MKVHQRLKVSARRAQVILLNSKAMRFPIKHLLAFLLGILPILGLAQTQAGSSTEAIKKIVYQVRPNIMVMVRVDQTNSCLVEVSALDPEYPPNNASGWGRSPDRQSVGSRFCKPTQTMLS